jgi:AbrB family looped-hinge helix DNA binding protein
MDQMSSTLTSKGQVTIPKMFRDSLDLTESDKVVFTMLDADTLAIRSASRNFMAHAGTVKAKKPMENSEKIQQKVFGKMAKEWNVF